MKTKLVLSLVACATFSIGALNAQTIEVTSTGVGIGTTTPSALLHVSKTGVTTSADIMKIVGAYDGSNVGGALTVKAIYHSGYGADYDFNVGRWVSGAFSDFSVLNLNANGNVGLGTTSPKDKLTLLGGAISFMNPAVPAWGTVVGLDYDSTTDALRIRANIGSDQLNTTQVSIKRQTGAIGIGGLDPTLFGRLTIQQTGTGFGSHGLVITSGQTNGGVALSDSGADAYKMLQSYGGALAINPQGNNVGIGTTSPSYKLEVAGTVRATSFISNSTTYADFVFKPDYKLPTLSEVESAIKANGHLPGIPSEAEAKVRGIDLAAMQVKLLQKVEELTLYLVAHEKTLQAQKQELQELRTQNEALQRKLSQREKR